MKKKILIKNNIIIIKFFAALFFIFIYLIRSEANIVFDDEIDNFFAKITSPILNISGLSDRGISAKVILSNEKNAFVTGNNNVYISSGLINETSDIEELIGVFAHEIAHIKRKDIFKIIAKAELLKKNQVLSTVLGVIIGISLKSPEIGSISTLAGLDALNLDILKFSRQQEESADKLALIWLSELGVGKDGMLKLFNSMLKKEQFNNLQNSYRYTHPLSKERIKYIKNFKAIKKPTSFITADLIVQYNLIKAKLYSLTNTDTEINKKYRGDKYYDLYAKVFKNAKLKKFSTSFNLLNELITKNPNYSYFYVTMGELFFENGEINKSNEYFNKAILMNKNLPVTMFELANNYISSKTNIKSAIELLNIISIKYYDVSEIWKKLGIAYEINKNYLEAYISFAKASLLNKNTALAKKFIEKAEKYANPDNTYKLRDIKKLIEKT
ncbi:MAG: putative Zn-dependent protease [Candidatus Midichloriaceae bacterium]|jgi:predicted Zn-dependent protease